MTSNLYLNVTARTPRDQITSPIFTAKANLSALVIDFMENSATVGFRLVDKAQEVRNAEELAAAQLRYLDLAERDPGTERLMRLLFNTANRLDDTFSGRNNDSRRAAHDAVREWATHQMTMLGN